MSKLVRTVSISANILLLAAVLYLYNQNKNMHKDDNGGRGHNGKISPDDPGSISGACNLCGDYANAPASQGLEITLLDSMTALYRKSMPAPTFKGADPADAKSVWFDLETLKKFVYEIEKNTCAISCGEGQVKLGVRIYYARYPATGTKAQNSSVQFQDLFSLDDDYIDRHTVFMVPTYSVNNGEPIDFNALDTFNLQSCSFHDIAPTGKILAIAPNSSALNHGGLCPPICPAKPEHARFNQ